MQGDKLVHFFYLDESGDTGDNLQDKKQPIFVLAGLSVADKKWNNTKEKADSIISSYFDENIPEGFEVHSDELLSPNGEGPFAGHAIANRLKLARDLLGLIGELGHYIHYFAIEKKTLVNAYCQFNTPYNNNQPYLLSFDYLITYMNWHVKKNLGQSARGMIVMDEKKEHHESIEKIIHNRRFEVPKNQKVKRIVEFSYPIDSRKNPMIQLSDLVALCVRRFLEIENGYKPTIPDRAKQFYAECFNIIDRRIKRHRLAERNGRNLNHLNEFLANVQCKPKTQWRKAYNLQKNN